MKKLMLVFGTRPEAIKMCPLVIELLTCGEFDVKVVVSAQHREMMDSVLSVFSVTPDIDLDVMCKGQTPIDVCVRVLENMKHVIERERPDALLVHGDTATAFSSALAAFHCGVPVYHVEAGLRSGDMRSPFPEELYRRSISLMSDVHFAPTDNARKNLINEGFASKSIFVTGNTVTDALRYTVDDGFKHPLLDAAEGKKIILLTAHRRENQGSKMSRMLRAVEKVISERDDVIVIFPVHMSPTVRKVAYSELEGVRGFKLCEPLDVLAMHNILARSYLVLTDSGGLQEEACALGVPALVMRDTTERTEGVIAGGIELIGTESEGIARSLARLLNDFDHHQSMKNAPNPYGDGHTCEKIVDIISKISTVHR